MTLEQLQAVWDRAPSRTKLAAWTFASRPERALMGRWIAELGPYDRRVLLDDFRALGQEQTSAGLVEPA